MCLAVCETRMSHDVRDEERRGCLMKRVVCLCRHVNPHSLLKTGYELI